jgi:hypothetical protein
MSLILISGCSSEATVDQLSEPNADTKLVEGSGTVLLDIESSNVRQAGYDVNTKVMTVILENGLRYEYFLVPQDLWIDFLEANQIRGALSAIPDLLVRDINTEKSTRS